MIAIIKYNAGNVASVQNTIKRLGFDTVITDDFDVIRKADKVIFPGVGEASSAMKHLKKKKLDKLILQLKQPVLGICLGMQLMCQSSEEGNTQGLGIFENKVLKFPPKNRVPHTGWNDFTDIKSELFKNLEQKSDFYFVHSFYAELGSKTIATTDYILPFSAALQKDNFYAVQFHPEKSAGNGSILLNNFLNL